MNTFRFPVDLRSIVCVGAHSDDIEIGAGGTIAAIAAAIPQARFTFIVLTGDQQRHAEARASAEALLGDRVELHVASFEDGYLPYRDPAGVKDHLKSVLPGDVDLVFCTNAQDLHQDHHYLAALIGQLCRDQPILGYELVKYDGDMGRPNLYVPLTAEVARAKTAHLRSHFASQTTKPWYRDDVFESIMRLRGVEAKAPEGYAEAFYSSKLVADFAT